MRNVKIKIIISGEECALDMPVSKKSIVEACGYEPSELIVAYYEDGIFYEDSTKGVELQGASNKVYVDGPSGGLYVYDTSTSQYTPVGGNSADLDDLKNMICPTLTITGMAGYEVTLVHDEKVIKTTPGPDGTSAVKLPSLGTWTVYPTLCEALTKTVNVSTIGNSYSTTLDYPTLILTTNSEYEMKLSCGDVVITAMAGSDGKITTKLPVLGTWTVSPTISDGAYANTVEATTAGQQYSLEMNCPTLQVGGMSGCEIVLTCGSMRLSATPGEDNKIIKQLPVLGTWTVTSVISGETYTEDISITDANKNYSLSLVASIYGVIWDGSSTTKLTRTDDGAGFSDPVPALNGTGGSSPFDDCYPWSDIEKVTIGGNSLVKIPKFWYKITKNGDSLKFQIADTPVDGFNVSPAHADRGDGKGERDYVYIGRYKCTTSSYKSVTGTSPKVSIKRSTARSGITSLGPGYYMQDFALWWTVRMLYLVEFADWNSQAVIGYNSANNGGVENTGTTDRMTYHTGTMQSSRTTYGTGVQYRWIEDPWGNTYEWCDGIRFGGSGVYVYKKPSEYSDSSGGVYTGTRPTSGGYISQWSVPTVEGYDWALYPSAVNGSESTYIPDYCNYGSSGVALCVGGECSRSQIYGAFYLGGNYTASYSDSIIGVRLQYLP